MSKTATTPAAHQSRAAAVVDSQRRGIYNSNRSDAQASAQATRASHAAHASARRRFVDPTTCDREYRAAELEFLVAIQAYKHSSGRMFPTWSEVLEVLEGLGYRKGSPHEAVTRPPLSNLSPSAPGSTSATLCPAPRSPRSRASGPA